MKRGKPCLEKLWINLSNFPMVVVSEDITITAETVVVIEKRITIEEEVAAVIDTLDKIR